MDCVETLKGNKSVVGAMQAVHEGYDACACPWEGPTAGGEYGVDAIITRRRRRAVSACMEDCTADGGGLAFG